MSTDDDSSEHHAASTTVWWWRAAAAVVGAHALAPVWLLVVRPSGDPLSFLRTAGVAQLATLVAWAYAGANAWLDGGQRDHLAPLAAGIGGLLVVGAATLYLFVAIAASC